MRSIIIAFFRYYLFWILFFIFFKVLFVVYNFEAIADLPIKEVWGIFYHGFPMDLSAAGHLVVLPGLIFALGFLFSNRLSVLFLKVYTFIFLLILTIIGLADIGIYVPWGSRIDAMILAYLETPGGVIASLNWYQLILFPVLTIAIVWAAFRTYNRIVSIQEPEKVAMKWQGAPVLLLLTAALIIPIRGGFDRAPLNHSNVYFSEHFKANQFAYNYAWNFIHSLLNTRGSMVEVNYMTDNEAKALLEANYEEQTEVSQLIASGDGKPINVVLVLLESFSNKVIEPLGGLPNITPRLNEFCNEGIAFDSFYATGNRSDKGISALIGGFPSDMNPTTVLKFPDQMNRLDYFPRYFADKGYNMSFYYGGDVNFYNTRAVMLQSGFQKIISKEDFPIELGLKQKWGVPDEYLYARTFSDLKSEKEPFFNLVYNISSHEPFDIDDYSKFPGSSIEQKYLNVVSYTDSCLGVFVDSLRASDLWDRTLVVITSDHTSLQPGPTTIIEPASFNIPLILIGGVVKDQFISKKTGNHNDLGPMLVKQMGWEHKPDLLSKDLLAGNDYAFYFHMNGWGFVSPEAAWFNDVNTGKVDFFYNYEPEKTDSLMLFAKAYVQYLHAERMKK